MVQVKPVIMCKQLHWQNSLWLLLSIGLIVLDQASKAWISQHMVNGQSWSLMPFVNFTLAHNHGAAFSFLSQDSGWQRWFLISLALIVNMVLLAYLLKLEVQKKWCALSLALIIGGALGNVIDRLFNGYVVDFIDVYAGRWHWPVFNIADSAIVVGVFLLILSSNILQVRQYDSNSDKR